MIAIPKFLKGDIVTHIKGGRAEVLDTQNDWSATPPAHLVTVRIIDTSFYDIRKIREEDLIIDRR